MKQITVNDLFIECSKQIRKGNGNKVILISDDDEGNGYHTLFFGFTDKLKEIQEIKEYSSFHDNNDPKGVVILG